MKLLFGICSEGSTRGQNGQCRTEDEWRDHCSAYVRFIFRYMLWIEMQRRIGCCWIYHIYSPVDVCIPLVSVQCVRGIYPYIGTVIFKTYWIIWHWRRRKYYNYIHSYGLTVCLLIYLGMLKGWNFWTFLKTACKFCTIKRSNIYHFLRILFCTLWFLSYFRLCDLYTQLNFRCALVHKASLGWITYWVYVDVKSMISRKSVTSNVGYYTATRSTSCVQSNPWYHISQLRQQAIMCW